MIKSAPTGPSRELIQSLPALPKIRLYELWNETFGRPAEKLRPEVMLPVLAFRIQEIAYGGLAPETKAQLRQIILSVSPKSHKQVEASARFKPGTRLVREWKGRRHEVILGADGYEYEGEKYKSLSSIACRITGTHCSGPAFFGTKKEESRK